MFIWCSMLCVSVVFYTIVAVSVAEKGANVIIRSHSQVKQCPTWYVPVINSTSKCVCGSTINGRIKCLEGEKVSIVGGLCMTYTDEQLLVGNCKFVPSAGKLWDNAYITVPSNVSEVNDFTCGSLNRTGLLCSQCQEGLSLAAMSYRRECVECSNPGRGVALFLVLSTIPTTAFFMLVMICSIDIFSGPMNAALVVLHFFLAKINQTPSLYLFKSENSITYYPMVALLTFYGIWNLDFLRYVIPPFCISSFLTSLQAKALEYVVAVYPLLLIVVTYICVEMYDNQYRVIVALWAPFSRIFRSRYFKNLNVKYSLLKTFATFIILSYTKIFNTSRALLGYTNIINSTGDKVKTVLLIDASIPYSSAPHVPYIVLAVSIILIFNLIPLFLLLLYPMKCFQLLLGKFPGVNWHPLRAFMDIFQGCYKNGTDGTCDYRYFAAFNFILRIAILYPMDDQSSSLNRMCFVLVVFIAMASIARPYQADCFNFVEIVIYGGFLLANLWFCIIIFMKHHSLTFVYMLSVILFGYVLMVCLVKIVKTLFPRCYTACMQRLVRISEMNLIPCCYYNPVANRADLMAGRSVSQRIDREYPERISNAQDYDRISSYHHRLVDVSTYSTSSCA